MSAALRNALASCLRRRRTPPAAALPRRAAARAPLHTAPARPTAVKITRQPVPDDLLGAIGVSVPAVEPLYRLSPAHLTTLEKHLEARDLYAAYAHFMAVDIAVPTPDEVRAAYANRPAEEGEPPSPSSPMGDYVPDTALQPVLTQLVAALLPAWGDGAAPHPLRLLERMELLGVCRSEHYAMLLTEALRRGLGANELQRVFERAVSFAVEANDLRSAAPDTTDPPSIAADVSTPHFLAFLVLTRGLGVKEESTLRYERVVRHSPYPSAYYARRFLEHHGLAAPDVARVMDLLATHAADTLFTNYYTLSLEIAQARSPDALRDLYARVAATGPRAPDVYTRFMTAFFELGCSAEAVGCWADMTRAAIIPTAVQWNELLRASTRSHDRLPVGPVWDMMLRAGCPPDHHCWTTRIHALLDARDIAAGLAALREMAASGTPPTTATINAALDGLLKHGFAREADAVLAAARALGIPKDLVTYNTELKALMKRQRTDTRTFGAILALTREMQSAGIVPDITTVTLILDGMYKYATPAPQLATVLGILQYVEDAGIPANIVTYTSILHALLRGGNEPAAMGILAIMDERGIVGNSTTYTVLLAHYFGRADTLSAERVIAEMEARRVPADARVYREIVLGYANAREPAKMLLWLGRVRERGVVLGLSAYMSFLRAMERKELLLEAKELAVGLVAGGVVDVAGAGAAGSARAGESEFWAVVRSMAGGAVWRELEREGRVGG